MGWPKSALLSSLLELAYGVFKRFYIQELNLTILHRP